MAVARTTRRRPRGWGQAELPAAEPSRLLCRVWETPGYTARHGEVPPRHPEAQTPRLPLCLPSLAFLIYPAALVSLLDLPKASAEGSGE